MATCFLFTEQFNEEQCLCLRLNQDGQVDAPLASRPFSEIRSLQANAHTIVVLPTACSSLHTVELPWLGERKARAAIPFALEEQLAQSVQTLHFSFDRAHYQQGSYLVVATDKQFLMDLMTRLDALDINFDAMTLDWFALNDNEAFITKNSLLVNDNLFKGALSEELFSVYLNNGNKTSQIFLFKDSIPLLVNENDGIIDSASHEWIAKRLLQKDIMSLCQGELQHDTRQQTTKQWYFASAVVAGALLVSIAVFKILYLHSLTKRIDQIDQKIAVIYREFFPQAHQVISPKFRIEQLLKSGRASNELSSFWPLLDTFAKAYKSSQFTIEQFRFQGKILSVTLLSNDFAALETLQSYLQQEGIKVTQAQASSHEHKVLATLELSL